MKWLSRVFTGPNFWLFNGFTNLALLVAAAFLEHSPVVPAVVMWLSFATADILRTIEAKSAT